MNTAKWLTIMTAAGCLTGGLLNLNAQPADAGQPDRPSRAQLRQRIKDKLGLTDEQAAQIRTEIRADKNVLKDLITRLHETRQGVRQAIQAPGATEASVRTASARVASIQADLAVERLKLHDRISPILTAEQQEKLKEIQGRIDGLIDGAINRMGERLERK
jgi:Spy/CpxP family protein refolding chaperone